MAKLKLNGIEKRYPNGAHAIRGVNMDIDNGELVVFVGPSGCGKSTLLRMIAGLETISAGDILLDDRRINAVSPADRDVAMVFQNYALYPHMTVYKNMAYGLRNRGTPKAEVDAKVRSTASTLNLSEFLDRKPRQLSGGQRQRVAMGRAIVRNPKVFLFDEPLSNLDAKLRVRMRIEIKRLQRDMGVTSVYVTHDQVEAMTLADRLAVINEGQVEQMGSPMELYENPRTLFVASFLGTPQINLMPASVNGGRVQAGSLDLPGYALPDGNGLLFGIRPEHLFIDQAGPLAMRVELIEQLGADNLVYGQPEGFSEDICVRCDGHQAVDIGDHLRINLMREKGLVFQQESGARVV